MVRDMRLVLLTTETSHHAYFAGELIDAKVLGGVVIETNGVSPQFDTFHPFEQMRDRFENELFFGGVETPIKMLFENTVTVPDLNLASALTTVKKMDADIFLTFGTRRLSREFIEQCGAPIINLHGGDPERYRGLDSHLWAIYHGEFSGLVTTIHRLNHRLDDGEIILQSPVRLRKGMGLHELRASNTAACVDLTLGALDIFARKKDFISRPQLTRGRYYSFMPACLKALCVEKFSKHTEGLS